MPKRKVMGQQLKGKKDESADASENGKRAKGSEEIGTAISPNQHPLLNFVVMDKVMEYLDPGFEELKQFRLVCKPWYEVTLDKWRKSVTLKLVKSDNKVAKEGGATLTEFLEERVANNSFLELERKPYKNVVLKGLAFSGKFMETPAFLELWNFLGHHIEYLSFDRCSFREPKNKIGAFQTIVFEKTPNLKKLVLSNNNVSYHASCKELAVIAHENLKTLNVQGKVPTRLQLLLPKIPKIERLRIRYGNEEFFTRSNFINAVLPALMLRRNDPSIMNIKHLDVFHTNFFKSSQSVQFYREVLEEIKLPLESLCIDVERRSEWRELISSVNLLDVILNGYSSTLRVLKVFRRPYAPPFPNFPFGAHMDNLTELHIWGNVTDNFCFLKNMPNLKKIFINTCCFDKWDEFREEIRCSCSPKLLTGFRYDMVRLAQVRGDMSGVRMTKLEFLYSTAYLLNKRDIETLAEWMPNLKILKMAINKNDIFSEVCLRWPKLEEIGLLLESHIDDFAITGRNKYQRTRVPCLKDLMDLKKFSVEYLCDCALSLFTERSVYDGFLKMDKLESLSVTINWRVSEKAVSDLKKKIAHVEVYRVKREGRSDLKVCEHLRFWEEMWLGWRFLDAAANQSIYYPPV